MTRLVRNPVTREFLTRDGQWTPDLHRAKPVADFEQAVALLKYFGMTQAELYYTFRDTFRSCRWDFSIPLHA
jgi:hypothetical protein